MDGIDNVGFSKEETIQDQTEKGKNGLLVKDTKSSEFCGWRSCTPDLIQKFASSRWLLFVICLFVSVQNIVTNGFVNVSITTLERRFDLSSSQAALISGGYDIGAGLGVVPVTYYCADRHKGKALTTGLILYGFGALLFSSPHFIAPKYNYNNDGTNASQTYCTEFDEEDKPCVVSPAKGQDLSKYLYVFVCAQVVMGLAATPLYTIGVAYMDENVKHRVISAYIGIFLMMAILAGAMGYIIGGYILNNLYINFIREGRPTNLLPEQWMGAWWLGFFVIGVLSFLVAIPMSCFPAHLPDYEKIFQEKIQASKEGNKEDEMMVSRTNIGKWRDLPSSTWQLLKNSTYMFVTLGSCFQAIIKTGIIVFLPKLLEVMFLLTAGTAATVTGSFGTIVGTISTLIVGWSIKKWKMGIFGMLKIIIAAAVVITFVLFSFFLKCPEPPLVGVNEPYDQITTGDIDLLSSCNNDCPCSDSIYDPVCGSDGRVYFDACYAGCTVYIEQTTKFQNCSCVPNNDDADLLGSSALEGACPTVTCVNLYIFMGITLISIACTFIPGPPLDTVTLRCVPHSERSLALAVQWVLARCLGTIPGPFLFGSLLDASCILWNRNCDGSRGRCHRYDRTRLSILLISCSIACSLVSLVFYGFAYASYKKKEKRHSEEFLEVKNEVGSTKF